MNKTKGVIITLALLLLFGTGTFVFANPSLENDDNTSGSQNNSPTIKKNENIKDNNNNQNVTQNENIDTTDDTENERQDGTLSTPITTPNKNNTYRPNNSNNNSSSNNTSAGSSSSNNNNNSNSNNDNTSNGGNNNSNNSGTNDDNNKPTPPTPETPGTDEDQNKPTEPENPGPINPPEEDKPDDNVNKAEDALDDLQDKLNQGTITDDDIENVKDIIDQITDSDKKNELIEQLEKIEELKELKDLIKELENLLNNANSKNDIQKIEEFIKNNDLANRIENLENSTSKDDLKNSLTKAEDIINILKDVEELIDKVKNALTKDDIEAAKNLQSSKDIFNRVDNISNSTIKNLLETELNPIKKIFDDNSAPEILGLKDGDIVNKVNISYKDNSENIKAYIGNKEVTLDYINNLKTEGTYSIDFIDEAFNKTTINFTIDTTLPIITGIKNCYNKLELENKVNIIVNDSSSTTIYLNHNGIVKTLNDKQLILDNTFTDGLYEIWTIDAAGNQSEKLSFEIDTAAPIINNIVNGKVYNKTDMINNLLITVDELSDVTIYFEKNGELNTVNGKSLTIPNNADGNYKLWATDKAGNNSNVYNFTVDTLAPIIDSFGIANVDETILNEFKQGDELQIYATFKEKLNNNPTLEVMNSTYEMIFEKEENGLFTYSQKYLITENSPLGNLNIIISNYADMALNIGDAINHTFENIKIVEDSTSENPIIPIDPTKPGFEFVNMKSFSDGNIYIAEPNYAGMIIHDNASGKDLGVTEDNKYTTTSREYTLTQSGAYEFTLYDFEGNVILSATMIFDNVAPVIKATSYRDDQEVEFEENETYEKIDFNITDDALHIIKYYKDGKEVKLKEYGKYATNNRLFTTSFTENGTYELVAIDRAGNETTKRFTINKKQSLLSMIFSMI